MNAYTIGAALATRFAPANVTPPAIPTGTPGAPGSYPNIRQSTVSIPNNLNMFPFVTVILPDGDATLAPQWVDYGLNFHVIFNYAKSTVDTARDITAMLAWLGVLLTQTYADMDLSVTGVKKAYPVSYQLTVETYGGTEFYGWDITTRVDFGESQVMTP